MLEVSGLAVRRGGRTILDGIDLRVVRGAIHVLIGESGAGKSTLLRCIAGLEIPDGGDVTIDGKTVTSGGVHRVAPHARGVAMSFQDDALWPHMSIEQHLRFGQSRSGSADARRALVDETLSRFGLAHRRHEKPGNFSGGERRRIGLARAMAHRAPLLLLDEPLAHVDLAGHRDLVSAIFDLLHQQETTAIWVTHRPEEVLRFASAATFLSGGRAGETVPPDEAARRIAEADAGWDSDPEWSYNRAEKEGAE